MANSLTALNKEMWEKEMQLELEKALTALDICKVHRNLKDGDTINKPYINKFRGQTYTKGSDLSMQDINATNEQLSIATAECVPVYIDKIDEVQNSYDLRSTMSVRAAYDLKRKMDAAILSDYDQATSVVYDSDIGGTSAVSAVVNASNINRLFSAGSRKLDNLNVPDNDRFAVVSPSIVEFLRLYFGGKDSAFGDTVSANGLVGSVFGFKVYKSTNLTYTARWTPADNPSNAQTITIAGVTFTFVTAIGTTAGNVLIGSTTADTLDNLVALLNDQGTTSATQVALSAASRVALEGIVATDGTTYLGIEFVGGGEVAVTTSVAADPWSLETVHCLFGRKGSIDIGLQRSPEIGFNQEPKRLPGSGNLIAWDLYGWKTFTDMKDEIVDVRVESSTFA